MTDCSISIIVPAYNVEKYLNEALDSIKSQEQPPDELILIDDGSSDSTLEIAKSYSFDFPYHIISIPNGGQGNARNVGINKASSEYIYFFDSDDLLKKNFVKSIKANIKLYGRPDIVLFSGQSFNDPDYKGNRWIDYRRGFSGYFENRIEFLDKGDASGGLFCQPCLYVSKKKLWGDGKLKFGDFYMEDEAIFFPLIFSCNNFLVVDDVYFFRRNREGSTMTMRPNIRHVNGALNCLQTSIRLYQRAGLTDKERWYIKKRIEGHLIAYVTTAREARIDLDLKKVFGVLMRFRGALFFLKFLAFVTGLNKYRLVKSLGRHLQSFALNGNRI